MLDRQRLRTFVLGGAVGALLGILLAPRSGKELRGSLANRAGEARERGRETYFDAQEQMRERVAEVREGARNTPRRSTSAPHLPPQGKQGRRGPTSGTCHAMSGPRLSRRAAERSEELRRKVRETRERLRGPKESGPER